MEKRNQRNNILMQLLSSALFCSAHPVVLHQLPQVINQRELLWIYLMERERDTWGLLSVERAADEYEAWQDYECVFSHSALILLLDGGSSPQGVDTIHCHGHAEVWLRLPALQPQLLHHRPHHITAALHTSDSLRQETPTEAWIQCLRKGNQRELKEEFHWFYMSKSVYRPWGERISDWKMHRNLLWLKRVLREVR